MHSARKMQHKYNIHATYVHFMKIPSRRREAAGGWDLPICTYVAFMLQLCCIFERTAFLLHFPTICILHFCCILIICGETCHAHKIGHLKAAQRPNGALAITDTSVWGSGKWRRPRQPSWMPWKRLGLKCPTYWVGRLCKNNSHTRKYRIHVKCEMWNAQ